MVQEKAQSIRVGSPLLAADHLPPNAVWRLAALAVICVGVPALYWPATSALAAVWTDTSRAIYLQGLPVALIALLSLARRRHEFAAQPMRPDPRALPFLLLLTLCWLIALRAGIQVGNEALLPLLLWFAVLALLGGHAARLCVFPMAFLYVAIPFWESATDALVFLTAHVSAHAAGLVGIAATVDGRLVRVPAGVFEVADTCSGLHYLMVGVATGALYGELHDQSFPRRALLLGLAAALSLVANWVRVTIIVITGQLTALQAPFLRPGGYHYLFGWVLLVIVLIGYILLGERLLSPPGAVAAPVTRPSSIADEPPGRPTVLVVWSSALLLLALGPAWAVYAAGLSPAHLAGKQLGAAAGGWTGPVAGDPRWQPRFPGADDVGLGTYISEGAAIEVYAAAYASQGRDKKFVGYDTSALGGTGWVLSAESILAAGMPVRQRVLDDDQGTRWVLWQWYQVGGRTFSSGWRAQLWYGLEALAAIPRSRTVILRAPCAATCGESRARLQQFVQDNPWLRSD